MDDITDFNCCRVCLARSKLIDIFEYDGELQIRDKVMYCAAVQIIKNDLLPTKICRTCKFYVDIAYIFKTVCEATHRKLIDFIRNKDVYSATEMSSKEPGAMDLSCDSKPDDKQPVEEAPDVKSDTFVVYAVEDHTDALEDNADTFEENADVLKDNTDVLKDKEILVDLETETETCEDQTETSEVQIETCENQTETHEDHAYTLEEHVEFVEDEVDSDTVEDNTLEDAKLDEDLNNEARVFDEEFIQEVEIDHSNINEEYITLPIDKNVDSSENKPSVSEDKDASDLKESEMKESEMKENEMLDNGKKQSVGRHVAKKNAGPHPRKLCQISSEDKPGFKRETSDHSYDEKLIYDHEIPTNTNEEVIIEQLKKDTPNDSPNERKSLRNKKKKTYGEPQKEGKNAKSFKISKKILKQKNKVKGKAAEVKGEHLCKVCKKTFPYYSHLKRHLITHSDVKQFKCSHCSSSFRNNYNLTVHLKRHTGDFQLRCEVCGKGFVSPSVLKRHMVTHTGEQQYQCQYCDKMFAHKASLKVHEYMHVYTPSYTCKICKKKFSYSNTLAEHMKSHLGIKNHKCNLCFRAFTRKTILVRHMKSCQTKRYKCKVCAFLILGINYQVHLKSHGIHKCLLCNIEFENASLLSSHNDEQHHERFVCVHCNKKCVNKNAYDKHNAKHQNCN